MIAYIIKTILCSASLFLIYYLLLEREKMYRFNRFFLLFSMVFSFGVAFITIELPAQVLPFNETIVTTDQSLPVNGLSVITTPAKETHFLLYIMVGLYVVVSAFLFYRFTRNISKIMNKVKENKKVGYNGATLVLTNENTVSHSFMNYLFLNGDKYGQGAIEKEVLQHEMTHIAQKHSLDVILVELMIVFGWFNPLLFLFRRSILLNHEFLADECVVDTFNDTVSYQLLLFKKASTPNNLILTSSFNYLITKKRLIMMTRKTSQKVALIKQISILPLIALLVIVFSTKVIAQDNPKAQKQREIQTTINDSVLRNIEITKAKLDSKQARKEELKKQLESKVISERKVQLDKEMQANTLYGKKVELNEMQKKLIDERKVELDKEVQKKSLLEQKVQLDEELHAKMSDEVKLKLEKTEQLKLKQDLKLKLEKEREAKLSDELKVKLEKEVKDKMVKEQK